MQGLFASGRIIDLILLAVAVEAAALAVLRGWWGLGPGLMRVLANLIAGVCLMVAVRLALVGAPWQETAAALFAALIAHLADLMGRWRQR